MNEIDRELAPAIAFQRVCDPASWYGAEITGFGGGLYRWSDEEIAEIDRAVRSTDWALPQTARKLKRMTGELQDGLGFVLARGFPAAPQEAEAATSILRGLARHFGTPLGSHTQGDVATVMALHDLPAGALSLVPALTVYNEMLKRRGDLLSELLRDRALFEIRDGYLSVLPQAAAVLAHGRRADRRLSRTVFAEVARELRHPLALQAGDILLVNSWVILPLEREKLDGVVRLKVAVEGLRPGGGR
jgi:hypothetical protein